MRVFIAAPMPVRLPQRQLFPMLSKNYVASPPTTLLAHLSRLACIPLRLAPDYSRKFMSLPRSFAIIAALFVAVGFASCTRQARQERVLRRAEGYFKAGEFDKAKIEYLNLLRLDPQRALAYQRLGGIWFDEGAPLRAAPFLVKSRELAPDDLQSRSKLARVLLSLGSRKDSFG